MVKKKQPFVTARTDNQLTANQAHFKHGHSRKHLKDNHWYWDLPPDPSPEIGEPIPPTPSTVYDTPLHNYPCTTFRGPGEYRGPGIPPRPLPGSAWGTGRVVDFPYAPPDPSLPSEPVRLVARRDRSRTPSRTRPASRVNAEAVLKKARTTGAAEHGAAEATHVGSKGAAKAKVKAKAAEEPPRAKEKLAESSAPRRGGDEHGEANAPDHGGGAQLHGASSQVEGEHGQAGASQHCGGEHHRKSDKATASKQNTHSSITWPTRTIDPHDI